MWKLKKLSACTSFICVAVFQYSFYWSLSFILPIVCVCTNCLSTRFQSCLFHSSISSFLIKFFCSHTIIHNLYYIYSFLLLLPAFSAIHSFFLSFALSVLFNRKQTVSFFFFVEKGGLAARVRK